AWDRAAELYRRALDILDGAGLEAVPERWHALVNLHITLRSRGRLAESLPLLEAAEEAARASGDEGARVFLENARGQLCMVRGDPEGAEARFRTALESLSGPGAAGARITVRLNLAEALLARDRLLDAAETIREAEMEAIAARVLPRLPEVYRLLGRVAAARGDADAFVLFERALELVRDHHLPTVEEARTLQAYAEAEAARGEAGTAELLRDRALARYREVGIEHPRHPWGEYFAPQDSDDPSPQHGGPHD
ncbi:MAG: hypothetical protein RQ751_08870, partial [Longimicrobiales bacterium]|nr:hypothetical protein [Longimicrobiales bacterium]